MREYAPTLLLWAASHARHSDQLLLDAELELLQSGLVQPGDLVIMTVGDVVGQVGTTNTMKIIKVGSRK